MTSATGRLQLWDREVDLATGAVVRSPPESSETRLTPTERKLLAALAAQPGQAMDREDLYQQVWGHPRPARSRTLDVTMRRLRSKVEADDAHPRHLITVQGIGYRFIGDASTPLAPARHAADHQGYRTNLADDATSFVGRKREGAELAALIAQGERLISVVGPPGVGKTRLVQHVTRLLLADQPTLAVWFCDLSQARTLGELAAVVGEALGQPTPTYLPPRRLVERLGRHLATRGPTVLVLDDFEQVASVGAEAVAELRDLAPTLQIVVTTRVRLTLPGERCWELDPLDSADALDLLLTRRAEAGHPADAGDAAVSRQLVDRLDRIPLAIELAALQLQRIDVGELLARLERQAQALSSQAARSERRGGTMARALDWSWALLEPWEQAAFVQCAVFAGGMTLPAVEAVVDTSDQPDAPWIIDIVTGLREKSMLRVGASPSQPEVTRLYLLQPLRAYALDRLAATGQRAAVEDRWRAWALTEARTWRARLYTPQHGEALAQLASERDNFAAVLDRSVPSQPDAAARLALAIAEVALGRGPLDGLALMLRRVVQRLEKQPQASARLIARVHRTMARVRLAQGRIDDAARAATRAAQAVTEPLPPLDRLEVGLVQALLAEARRDTPALVEVADQLATLASELPAPLPGTEGVLDAPGVALALSELARGQAALAAGRADEAAHWLGEGVAGARLAGDTATMARGLHRLSMALDRLGRTDDAARARDDAAAAYRASGLRREAELLSVAPAALS